MREGGRKSERQYALGDSHERAVGTGETRTGQLLLMRTIDAY